MGTSALQKRRARARRATRGSPRRRAQLSEPRQSDRAPDFVFKGVNHLRFQSLIQEITLNWWFGLVVGIEPCPMSSLGMAIFQQIWSKLRGGFLPKTLCKARACWGAIVEPHPTAKSLVAGGKFADFLVAHTPILILAATKPGRRPFSQSESRSCPVAIGGGPFVTMASSECTLVIRSGCISHLPSGTSKESPSFPRQEILEKLKRDRRRLSWPGCVGLSGGFSRGPCVTRSPFEREYKGQNNYKR